MGLAEDLKALQELRDKGELSEADYAAARDAAVGKQAPLKPAVISKPTKLFLTGVILLISVSILYFIYISATLGRNHSVPHAPITISDDVQNIPANSWKALNYNFPSGRKTGHHCKCCKRQSN